MKTAVYVLLIVGLLVGCKNASETSANSPIYDSYQTVSLLGDTLWSKTPSEKLQITWQAKKEAFENDPDDLEKLIWYGRFTAYKGDYRGAIDLYTKGLAQFPNEPRLLRHIGHRYITVREFDKAITDLSLAAQLIENTENQIEEDGMPNAQNIPVSTLHGNIYYHLGLAHYLNRNMPKALEAYEKCLSTSPNADNVVSATHWIYMINRRLGRTETANDYLKNIHKDMNVIENFAYHKACLFYKGLLPLDSIYDSKAENNASNSAIKYAVGNWFWYNGKPAQGKEIYHEILKGEDWASFGYLAAEADIAKPFVSK